MSVPKHLPNHHNYERGRSTSRSRNRRHHNTTHAKSTSKTESDLFMISASDDTSANQLSTHLIHTAGQKPPPRVGYSCVLMEDGEGLVVWGGRPGTTAAHDALRHGRTETYAESLPCERHSTHSTKHTCDSVYCLDFGRSFPSPLFLLAFVDVMIHWLIILSFMKGTYTWTRLESRTQGPTSHNGVKGHATALIGSSLFVFGGIGKSNDLWTFDFSGGFKFRSPFTFLVAHLENALQVIIPAGKYARPGPSITNLPLVRDIPSPRSTESFSSLEGVVITCITTIPGCSILLATHGLD